MRTQSAFRIPYSRLPQDFLQDSPFNTLNSHGRSQIQYRCMYHHHLIMTAGSVSDLALSLQILVRPGTLQLISALDIDLLSSPHRRVLCIGHAAAALRRQHKHFSASSADGAFVTAANTTTPSTQTKSQQRINQSIGDTVIPVEEDGHRFVIRTICLSDCLTLTFSLQGVILLFVGVQLASLGCVEC